MCPQSPPTAKLWPQLPRRAKVRKRTWWAVVDWKASGTAFGVRAWTRRGAVREATRRAKILKPKADLMHVGVCR